MELSIYGLLLFALGLVWWMWRHIRSDFIHLEDEDIDAMLSDRIGKEELRQAREHLLRCESCKLRFDEMTRQKQKLPPERWLKRRF